MHWVFFYLDYSIMQKGEIIYTILNLGFCLVYKNKFPMLTQRQIAVGVMQRYFWYNRTRSEGDTLKKVSQFSRKLLDYNTSY